MKLRLITAATNPVTLAEAKTHLRADDGTAEDSVIEVYLAAALAHVDGRDGILGRAVAEQTWEVSYDAFPDDAIVLPLPPLRSVTSIVYDDADGVEQTLAPAAYLVDTASEPGRVTPVDEWPATADTPGAVRVTFVAGYATTPAAIKAAILLLVGDLYAHREAAIDSKLAENPSVNRLLFPYRMLTP